MRYTSAMKPIALWLNRCGLSLSGLARKANVKPHRIKDLFRARKKTDVGQERLELLTKVVSVVPPEEASGLMVAAAESQAGGLAPVVAKLREEVLALRRRCERQDRTIAELCAKLESHHTPPTARKAVRRMAS